MRDIILIALATPPSSPASYFTFATTKQRRKRPSSGWDTSKTAFSAHFGPFWPLFDPQQVKAKIIRKISCGPIWLILQICNLLDHTFKGGGNRFCIRSLFFELQHVFCKKVWFFTQKHLRKRLENRDFSILKVRYRPQFLISSKILAGAFARGCVWSTYQVARLKLPSNGC